MPRSVPSRSGARLAAVLLAVLGLCASASPVLADAPDPQVTPPPAGTRWDYQIGGARDVPADVGIVSRDREDTPRKGAYNVCYVNGFQTQDSELRFWRSSNRWPLVLKDKGRPVVDSGWGEFVLDTRTSTKRAALATIVGRWIDGCARDGFQAVEIDNLDSFYRSHGLITRQQNKRFASLLIERAHAAGLAIGQKNWPELGARGKELGFDFAVAEECGQYDECESYTDVYGPEVLAVEYTDRGFTKACTAVGDLAAVVRRDRAVTPSFEPRWCGRG